MITQDQTTSPRVVESTPSRRTTRKLSELLSSATSWSFLAVGLRLGANVIILPIVVRVLPTEHLGLWYVFVSLGSFANLADFGLGNTVMRAVSFFWAGAAQFTPQGIALVQGVGEPNYNMLSKLLASARRLYRLIGVCALALMVAIGFLWFSDQRIRILGLPIEFVWIIYALGVSANLYTNYWNCFLVGIGKVKESQRAMAIGQILYLLLMVCGLLSGGGLLVLAIGAAVPGLVNRLMARTILLTEVRQLEQSQSASPELMNNLWPNTWRFGCVMLGGYFIYNSNLWLCSQFLGLRATAEYGLTFQICQVLFQISSIFVTVKLPIFNQYRSRGATSELANLFIHQIRKGILIFTAGAIALVWLGQPLLNLIGSKTHILPSVMFAFMLGYQFLEFHHCQHAALVMTGNEVPFVAPALVSGFAIFILGYFLVHRFGLSGLLGATAVVQLSFNNWWTVWKGLQGMQLDVGQYFAKLAGR